MSAAGPDAEMAPEQTWGSGAERQSDSHPLLTLLRAGNSPETLFLVPGLEGETAELDLLVSALAGPQTVVAVVPPWLDDADRDARGMRELATAMLVAVRSRQPQGPYRIGGYSFGALLALEMAQQLREAGAVVDALFLIEGVYDERYWPRAIWRRAIVRRSGRHLVRILRMPPAAAFGELRHRATRLVQRLERRLLRTAADPLSAGETVVGARAYAAISGYRPQYYADRMTVIASTSDQHFGCETADLWAERAKQVDIARVDGDHLSVLHDPVQAGVVANIIDHRLAVSRPGWPGLRPRPGFSRALLLTTMHWFSVTRLAHTLIESGFEVSACHPRGHSVATVDGLEASYRLNRMSRSRSVLRAIRATRPDIVLPDDEQMLALLRELYHRTLHSDPTTAAVLGHSLGNIADWPSITSRSGLAGAARALGISAPNSQVVSTCAEARERIGRTGYPVALKTDGSWGGRGVAIVEDEQALLDQWRRVSSPPTILRAGKRLLVDGDVGSFSDWARRKRPVVNAQDYIRGKEAMTTVACLNGEVLNLVSLVVLQTTETRGPASVVRTIDHPEMAAASRLLVSAFGLSGFCGFDFILDEYNLPWLIELNSRVTPTSYCLVDGDFLRDRTFALFPPDESLIGATETAAQCDRPVRAPALVRRGEIPNARYDVVMGRSVRRLQERFRTTK